ncbi:hypothetical protein [Planctomyces sp. SH-PL14]|uniref:hypothetical protein n=1 Tax=Planctomyces sp. SH-PL14 TaxID=1632864 RepID=UPI0009466896|nr:hypothetical protein [Planctomyces sp. SH-PL14]
MIAGRWILHPQSSGDHGVFVLSRSLGQSVVVDETFILVVASIGEREATLIRTDESGLHGVEFTIRPGCMTDIAPGVGATLIPFEKRKVRIGFVTFDGHVVRAISSALRSSSDLRSP